VSALRSNPDIDYVVASNDLLISGLPAALSTLGLNPKIIGAGGTTENFQYIATGKQTAELPFAYYESDYMMMDALARFHAGVDQDPQNPPRWIVTQDNLPTESEIFPVVEDYKEQYTELWGK
jgi:ABC-type sugar transport system substrate-binding protein